MLVQLPYCRNILALQEHTLETCPGEFWACWFEQNMLSGKRTHTHRHTQTQSALQEEAHCAEGRSMEGSGCVKRGKAETSRRLFSASPAPPPSGDPAGQCFAPGYSLSAQEEDAAHFNNKFALCKC